MSYSREALEEYIKDFVDLGSEPDCIKTDCEIQEFFMQNCTITITEESRFFVQVNCGYIMSQLTELRAQKYHEELRKSPLQDGVDAYAYTGLYDIGHTAAVMEDVVSLGIVGLRNRLAEYAAKCPDDAAKQRFYTYSIRTYDAALQFMLRVAEETRAAGKTEMADSLIRLTRRAPETLYEALQTVLVYYTLQQMMETTHLRTLGRLDSLLQPFYEKEQNPEKAKELSEDFIKEIDELKICANMPFAIGGTDLDGNTMYCDMSHILLDAYSKVHNSNVKLHFLYNDNTPQDILEEAFECVRAGMNSICFMSDKKVTESLIRLGEDPVDAACYAVVGCYECGGREEITCTCNGRVTIPKAVEYALNNGKDFLTGKTIGLETKSSMDTFEDFMAVVKEQLVYLSNKAIEATDLYERHYDQLHAAPIFSATYLSAVESGRDVYCASGAKYCNSSINAIGLATAVDSLAAIKKLVYEKKRFSLEELTAILQNDWKDQEVLRLTIKNKFPKYGIGNPEVDGLAADILETLSAAINSHPNQKGGVYRLGTYSIDWRIPFGEHTGASADGRKSGEPLSQNTGASFGADREGATAHILSVTALDMGNTANGSILDLDLHSSAVKGRSGMQTLINTLKTYFNRGGFAIHYNVLDADILKAAKRNPEQYPNLQVRLCGWNVLFSSLSEQAQEEFIARAGYTG